MATVSNPELPFKVRPYKNPRSGAMSWRVTGTKEGGRIRLNFADHAEAEMVCNEKNAQAMGVNPAALSFTQTRLSLRDVAAAESGVTRAQGRWTLAQIIDTGLAALSKNPNQALAPLFEQWLLLIEQEVGARWLTQLRSVGRMFLAAHPGITTEGFARATVRKWLDEDRVSGTVTKRNRRAALSRFGGWLQERFDLPFNPVGGIRMTKSRKEKDAHHMPVVFSTRQVEAWMHAVQQPPCRRLKGWAALCLFGGIRPNSEALMLTWAEIDLTKKEINIMGTKRGAKPRILPLNATLEAWIIDAKKDGEDMPGFFARAAFRQARELANAWLAERHPSESLIEWTEDMQRHTYASMRAGSGIKVSDLAREMGTSESTYYAHYKNPRSAAEVKAFWEILPSK